MRQFGTSWRWACAVWAVWLLLLGTLAALLSRQIWHPHFLPVTALLVLLVAAGALLVGSSVWQIARGPRKRSSLAWLLVGIAPLWFMAGHFLHGLQTVCGRNVQLSYPLKLLVPLGGPEKVSGTFVVVSRPSASTG
jgi:hypothetical protein